MSIYKRFGREIEYSLTMVSALGAYPLHALLIIVFIKLEQYPEALTVALGFIGLYMIGGLLRAGWVQYITPPINQVRVGLSATKSSFPSYHVTRITFLSWFFSDIFGYEWDIVLLFVCLTVLISYTRVRFQHHYWIDVYGGVVLGLFLYILADRLAMLFL